MSKLLTEVEVIGLKAQQSKLLTGLQLTILCLFLTLLFLPIFLSEAKPHDTLLTHFTLTANYLIWGLWFPLVLLSVIFVARFWCGFLCPMGLLSEWANRIGLQKPIPKWLQHSAMPILSFVLITLWGQTLGVRDHPESIALVFGSCLAAAIIVGGLFGKNQRAWCRHLCPIGLLLGMFSRLGMLSFVPKRLKPGVDIAKDSGICPTRIDINRKTSSRHCIACFRCARPKSERSGLALQWHKPGSEIENIALRDPKVSEIWFLNLCIGITLGAFLWLSSPLYTELRRTLGEWSVTHNIDWLMQIGPSWLMVVQPQRNEVFYWLDFISIFSFITTCTIVVALAFFCMTKIANYIGAKEAPTLAAKQQLYIASYQFISISLTSLLIGLGNELFTPLLLIHEHAINSSKVIIIIAAWLWSQKLGLQILTSLGLSQRVRFITQIPYAIGGLLVSASWLYALGVPLKMSFSFE